MLAAIRNRVGSRRHYADTASWLMSLYNGLVNRWPLLPLPGRGQVWRLRPVGLSEPILLRQGSSDWPTMRTILFRGEYDSVLESLPADIRTILDLGANVGLSIRFWLEHLPDARVIAVEPLTANMALCQRNVNLTRHSRRVALVQAAVSGNPGQVRFALGGPYWSARMTDDPGDATEMVQAVTVGRLIQSHLAEGESIDLLKCDIEGAEAQVFAECRAWLPRVRNIVIETHAPYTIELWLADLERNGGRFELRWSRRHSDQHTVAMASQKAIAAGPLG